MTQLSSIQRSQLSLASKPRSSSTNFPVPPTDEEMVAYFKRGPQRWLTWLTVACFGGVAFSLAGFSYRLQGDRIGADPWINLALYLPLTFFGPLVLYTVTILISAGTSTAKPVVDLKAHQLIVKQFLERNRFSTVDVFLPSAGEPIDLLANTYDFVSRLIWPGELRVYVLDDSGRTAVKEIAEGRGFTYTSRNDRGFMKKAGNLKHGFGLSGGEFIAILDADFVPRSDYLLQLIPYFDDPGVGIVQSPQYFDTSRTMSWLQRAAGATQELFYRGIQCGRGRIGAAICVGTCAVYRRSALADIGGFPQIGHSEDVYTGVRMAARDFSVRYIPIIASKGLCPDNLSAFINQQYRWCTGSLTLMQDRTFRENRLMTRSQRLCYWSGFLYYIGTAVQTATYFLPALIMVWFFPQYVFASNSLPLMGVIVLWFLVFPVTSVCRWRPEVLRVQTIYGFAHLMSIRDVASGSEAGWVPTNGKSKSPLATNTKRIMCVTICFSQLFLYLGIWHGSSQYGFMNYWAMLALTLFRSYIEIPIVIMCAVDFLRGLRGRTSNTLTKSIAAARKSSTDEARVAVRRADA